MSESVRIALPKLFLWSEPSRFQEYPEALARAQAGRQYTRVEVERELFDVVPTLQFEHGAPRGKRTDGIVNLYGLERTGDRYRLNGLGLLHRASGRISVSEDGLRLGSLYRENPAAATWAEELARMIALREPRTRLILLLMAEGAELLAEFADTDPSSSIELRLSDGERLAIRWSGSDEFNTLLQQYAYGAIGPHWTNVLGIGRETSISLEGVVHGRPPSTNGLSTALRRSLTVFHDLGLFEGDADGWTLNNHTTARRLGACVVRSLGGGDQELTLTDDQAFTRALADTVDADGFVIVARLADRFGELLNVPAPERTVVFDTFVRGAMYHERLRIIERHPGQPRMGRGLFGETGSRRIRLDFHISEPHPAAVPKTSSSLDHARENTGEDL